MEAESERRRVAQEAAHNDLQETQDGSIAAADGAPKALKETSNG
jgi:hypothetical protein